MADKNNISFPHGFIPPHALSGSDEKAPFLVAFSGGADSRALFDLAARYCREKRSYFYAAHVNHGIRGDEAIRDRDFCIGIAKSCPECRDIFVLDADVPKMASESGRSLELEARLLRYSFFNNIMKENDIGVLATAHNADDNLETLIFNLTRGSGSRGMRGIPRSRRFEGGIVVRPILDMTKTEILEYCRENSLDFVIDSTNGCTEYSRNLIRAKIVPLLEEINPEVRRSAMRLADSMRETVGLVESMAKNYDMTAASIASAPRALLAVIFEKELEKSGDHVMLEAVHVEALRKICKKGKNGASVSLPGNIRGIIKEDVLVFETDTGRLDSKKERAELEAELSMGDNLLWDGYRLILSSQPSKGGVCITLDESTLRSPLYARNRREGDRILSGGMHKSVKKLMCDKKLDSEIRDSLPLLCDGDGIVWIPYVAVRDKAKKQNGDISVTLYTNKSKEV